MPYRNQLYDIERHIKLYQGTLTTLILSLTQLTMSSDQESFHSATGEKSLTSLNNYAIVSDSQESSGDEPSKIITFNEGTELSDSTEDDNDDGDTNDDHSVSEEQELVHPGTKRPKLDRNTKSRMSDPPNQKGFIQVQESDLSGFYGKELSMNMDKLNSMQSLIHKSPLPKQDSEIQKQFNAKKDALFKEVIDSRTVKQNLVDAIIHENITNKFQDWHFIRRNCSDSIELGLLTPLMASIGCEMESSDPVFTITDADVERYDSYCRMFPVGYMLDHICTSLRRIATHGLATTASKTKAAKFFVCFILDRKVYESIDMNPLKCTSIYRDVVVKYLLENDPTGNMINILDELFINLDKNLYFMINRLTTLIPELKNPLMAHYFKNDINNVIAKFNTLMDDGMYESLLYFIMLIYGSYLLPFEKSDKDDEKDGLENNHTHKYFKECVYDMSTNTTSDVEISLMKVLLNLYSKVNT